MTAIESWETEYPYHMILDRSPGNDRYHELKEALSKHGISCMLLGNEVGFRTEEELTIAKLIY